MQVSLHLGTAEHGLSRIAEGDHESVALALHDMAAVVIDQLVDESVVAWHFDARCKVVSAPRLGAWADHRVVFKMLVPKTCWYQLIPGRSCSRYALSLSSMPDIIQAINSGCATSLCLVHRNALVLEGTADHGFCQVICAYPCWGCTRAMARSAQLTASEGALHDHQ